MFDLTGRVALVTGGGRGVGRGISRVLIDAGAQVWINDLVPERAEDAAAALGPAARALPFDVASYSDTCAAIDSAGPIDILVNNAGIPPTMSVTQFRTMEPSDWEPYIDVNLYGVLHCVKATIESMCARGWGRVITISSGSGIVGQRLGVSLYAAGKGAGISFMRHLAMECARDGVTANTIALGMMSRDDQGGEQSRSATREMAAAVPVGRLGTGADTGYFCAFLASDEASWVTGQTFQLNGGSVTS